jgi:hypothetical protein
MDGHCWLSVEDERDLSDLSGIGQARTDRVHLALEAVQNGWHVRGGVTTELAIVVTDHAQVLRIAITLLAQRMFSDQVSGPGISLPDTLLRLDSR